MTWIVLNQNNPRGFSQDYEICDTEQEVFDLLEEIGMADASPDDDSVLIFPYEEAHTVDSFRTAYGF